MRIEIRTYKALMTEFRDEKFYDGTTTLLQDGPLVWERVEEQAEPPKPHYYNVGEAVVITKQANENGLVLGQLCRILGTGVRTGEFYLCVEGDDALISRHSHPISCLRPAKENEIGRGKRLEKAISILAHILAGFGYVPEYGDIPVLVKLMGEKELEKWWAEWAEERAKCR